VVDGDVSTGAPLESILLQNCYACAVRVPFRRVLKCGAARGIGGISGRIAEIIVGIALAIGEATKLSPTKEARDVELVQLLSVRQA